jgi:hypothetical protein
MLITEAMVHELPDKGTSEMVGSRGMGSDMD